MTKQQEKLRVQFVVIFKAWGPHTKILRELFKFVHVDQDEVKGTNEPREAQVNISSFP